MKFIFSHHTPNFKEWIDDHDDRWSFIILYVGTAILLSLFAGLFWVMILMLAHIALEYVRHIMAEVPNAFANALWQTKLDIALILFALVIALYSDTVMAALGLGQSARAAQAARGLQLASRLGVIESALRTFLLTVDDFTRLARALWRATRKRKSFTQATSEIDAEPEKITDEHIQGDDDYPWRRPGIGDFISIGFGCICLTLLLIAPLLTDNTATQTIRILIEELTP